MRSLDTWDTVTRPSCCVLVSSSLCENVAAEEKVGCTHGEKVTTTPWSRIVRCSDLWKSPVSTTIPQRARRGSENE